jgi:hypothetical protein
VSGSRSASIRVLRSSTCTAPEHCF